VDRPLHWKNTPVGRAMYGALALASIILFAVAVYRSISSERPFSENVPSLIGPCIILLMLGGMVLPDHHNRLRWVFIAGAGILIFVEWVFFFPK
jgi:hypothetical protein